MSHLKRQIHIYEDIMQKVITKKCLLEDFQKEVNKHLEKDYFVKTIETHAIDGSYFCCTAVLQKKKTPKGYVVKVGDNHCPAGPSDIAEVQKALLEWDEKKFFVTHQTVKIDPYYED